MRKIFLIVLVTVTASSEAQLQPVLKNRRGIPVLPKAGDYCLGLSANPFLSYVGNMFNNSSDNQSPRVLASSQMFFGKYMKSSRVAYRGSLTFGINSQTYTIQVQDLAPGAPLNAQVADVMKQRNTRAGISFGIEKRRGETRLQGFYGAELALGYHSGINTTVEYGNRLEYLDTGMIRTISQKGPSSFTIGIRGFAGVEYFIAPGISIGGEILYGPSFTLNGAGESTTEHFDFSNSQVVQEKREIAPKNSSFSMDIISGGGIMKLLFYF